MYIKWSASVLHTHSQVLYVAHQPCSKLLIQPLQSKLQRWVLGFHLPRQALRARQGLWMQISKINKTPHAQGWSYFFFFLAHLNKKLYPASKNSPNPIQMSSGSPHSSLLLPAGVCAGPSDSPAAPHPSPLWWPVTGSHHKKEAMEIQTEPHQRNEQRDHITRKSKCSRSPTTATTTKEQMNSGKCREMLWLTTGGSSRLIIKNILGFIDELGLTLSPPVPSADPRSCSSSSPACLWSGLGFRAATQKENADAQGWNTLFTTVEYELRTNTLTVFSIVLCSSARVARSSGCEHSNVLTIKVSGLC